MPLVDRLQLVAALWAESHADESGRPASLARLGKAAIKDTGFFDRLGERGPTTATLEKFARFLADPANWPPNADGESAVPEEAKAFAHVTGVTPEVAATSPGKADENSPAARAA